jgi:hypothetical protein
MGAYASEEVLIGIAWLRAYGHAGHRKGAHGRRKDSGARAKKAKYGRGENCVGCAVLERGIEQDARDLRLSYGPYVKIVRWAG